MLGGCLIGGSGPSNLRRAGFGEQEHPDGERGSDDPASGNESILFHEQAPQSKNVWSLASGARGLAMLVSSGARLGARAGLAQPGARDGRLCRRDDPEIPAALNERGNRSSGLTVHRQDDPAMRTATGTPLGCGGRPLRIIRASFGTGAGKAGASRHDAQQKSARSQVRSTMGELINLSLRGIDRGTIGTQSRVGDSVRPVVLKRRSVGWVLHLACQGAGCAS